MTTNEILCAICLDRGSDSPAIATVTIKITLPTRRGEISHRQHVCQPHMTEAIRNENVCVVSNIAKCKVCHGAKWAHSNEGDNPCWDGHPFEV